MEIIIFIIITVFAVFQIILFFKLWSASNDIAKIRALLMREPNQVIEKANEELAIGNKNKALELIKRAKYRLATEVSKSNYYSTEKVELLNSVNKMLKDLEKHNKTTDLLCIGDFVSAKNNPETLMQIVSMNKNGEFDCMTPEGEFIGTFNKEQLIKE